jgi:putative transposase
LNYVGWKRRAEVAADLKTIYQSATVEEAEQYLTQCKRPSTPYFLTE